MAGRNFLDIARFVLSGQSEYHWRAAVIHAYYSLFLECRDALLGWGQHLAKGQNVHAWTRLRFVYSTSTDLKLIADALDKLTRLRNKASYELTTRNPFSSPFVANDAIQTADQALALLDQILADPLRRQSAVRSLPP